MAYLNKLYCVTVRGNAVIRAGRKACLNKCVCRVSLGYKSRLLLISDLYRHTLASRYNNVACIGYGRVGRHVDFVVLANGKSVLLKHISYVPASCSYPLCFVKSCKLVDFRYSDFLRRNVVNHACHCNHYGNYYRNGRYTASFSGAKLLLLLLLAFFSDLCYQSVSVFFFCYHKKLILLSTYRIVYYNNVTLSRLLLHFCYNFVSIIAFLLSMRHFFIYVIYMQRIYNLLQLFLGILNNLQNS